MKRTLWIVLLLLTLPACRYITKVEECLSCDAGQESSAVVDDGGVGDAGP